MIRALVALVFVLGLAYAIRRAAKGTPFARRCPCTPYIKHLCWLEKGEKREDKKRENLW